NGIVAPLTVAFVAMSAADARMADTAGRTGTLVEAVGNKAARAVARVRLRGDKDKGHKAAARTADMRIVVGNRSMDRASSSAVAAAVAAGDGWAVGALCRDYLSIFSLPSLGLLPLPSSCARRDTLALVRHRRIPSRRNPQHP